MTGTAVQALEWALDYCADEPADFLRAWREGDLADWPEYWVWLYDGRVEPPQTNEGAADPTATVAFYHHIQAAEVGLEQARRAYLKRWGWSETCNTPGSYWLWQRDFADYDAKFDDFYARNPDKVRPAPTGTLRLPEDLAIAMTVKALDDRPELAEGED